MCSSEREHGTKEDSLGRCGEIGSAIVPASDIDLPFVGPSVAGDEARGDFRRVSYSETGPVVESGIVASPGSWMPIRDKSRTHTIRHRQP
jgi:hypothetical protein